MQYLERRTLNDDQALRTGWIICLRLRFIHYYADYWVGAASRSMFVSGLGTAGMVIANPVLLPY